MRKAILNLVCKSLYCNKKQSLIYLIGIALCLTIITSTFIIYNSYNYSYSEKTKNIYGSQDAILYNTQNQGFDNLAETKEISKIGIINITSIYKIPNDILTEEISIGYMNEIALQLGRVQLSSGKMPTSKNEICLTKSALFKLKISEQLNQKITLRTYALDLNGGLLPSSDKEYIIVGILGDFMQPANISDKQISGYTQIPSILISQFELDVTPSIRHAIINVTQGTNARDLITNTIECQKAVFTDISLQSQIDSTGSLIFMLNLLLVSICIMGIYCIDGVFSLSYMQQINKLAHLKLLGASTKMLRLYTFYTIIFLLLISLPFGLLTGILGSFGLCKIFNNVFSSNFTIILNLKVIAIPIIITSFTVYIMLYKPFSKCIKMPIMEALSTKQSKVIYSPKYKFKNPLYLWALKSAFSSPGLASAVIAMAISFTVFIGGLFIAGAIRDEYKSYMQSDYHISYNNTLCGGDLMIPIDIQGGMSSEDISYLRSNNDIKQVWSVKTIPVNILLEKATQESLLIGTLADRELKDADASKIKYGYHKDDRLFKSYITGVDDDLLQALNKFLVQGSINLEKLRTGEEVIICTKLEDIPCKLGDKITLTQLIVDRELPRYSLEGAVKVTKKATIGGIVKLPVGFNKFTNIFYNDTNVLWGNDAFKALKIDSNYTNVYIDLKDVNIFKGVEDILKILKESHPTGLSFDSRREQNIKQKEVVTIVYIFTYSISIIVGCMAILNIVNHVIYRIRVRKRELGMLRAIGLTKKQMTKILQIELVSIVLTSIIIGGLLLTTLFVYIAMTSSMDYIKFIPFKEVILTIIVLLIIPILTIRFLVNSFYKKSVVEQIKWVE